MGQALHNAIFAALLGAMIATGGCAETSSVEVQTGASLTAQPVVAARPVADPTSNLLRLAGDIEARGSLETALPLYERAAAEPDASVAVQTRLADAYAKLGRYPEAEKAYRAALAKQADYGPALLGLGGVLVRTGRGEDGVAMLAKAAPLVNQATAYDRLGIAHMSLGQPREALACFEQAHAMAPKDIDIATNLALAAALAGQYDKAAALANEIAGAEKLRDYHRRNLILVLGIAGHPDEAKRAAGDVIDEAGVAQLLKQAQALRKTPSSKSRALALGTVNPRPDATP